MATTSQARTSGTPARGRRELRLRIAALVVVLAGFPVFAPNAVAQRPPVIRAKAYVTPLILAVVWRPDSASVPAPASVQPGTERIRIAGVGSFDVRRGPGGSVRVIPWVEDPSGRPTVTVQLANVAS
jgi:hypothetical protein